MNYPCTKLLIDNVWVDAQSGKTIPVINPATGTEIGRVAHADEVDLAKAVAAAERGFALWRFTPQIERSNLMRKAAQLMRERAADISALMTQEQGKPLAEARAETMMGVETIEWFAEEGRRAYGRIVPARGVNITAQVHREPVGIVAAFTPWNFPINQIVRKLCAALTTGCAIIIKAPEETPASPAAMIQAFVDAGIPPGVIGLVYGVPAQISSYLIPHPSIRKITFTGSTPVGKQLASLAGLHMKRVTMELGGHAPVIVCEDADLENAVKSSGAAKFRNAGQVCISPTRFLVHNRLKADFLAAFVDVTKKLKVGNGMQEGTTMGALANPRRLAAMQSITEDAVQKGAKLVAGGERIGESGNFFAPTILADVPMDAIVQNNEPFGPMAAVRGFDDLEEALREANRLPFGLAGYAYTRSIKNYQLLAQRLEVGMLWINQPGLAWPEMPFGGVKDSGYGSEGGSEALEAYLNTKAVAMVCL